MVSSTRGGIVGACDRLLDRFAGGLEALATASAELAAAKDALEYQEARLALTPAVSEGRTETERRYRLVMELSADEEALRAKRDVQEYTLTVERRKADVQVLRERIAVERTYLSLAQE